MRQALQTKGPRGAQIAITDSQPAPVGGWNARDSVATMDERDAILLQNWFPKPSQVVIRKGYVNWATGITGQVESIMSYVGAATAKLFAANSGNIYDVTSQGAVGAAVQTGLTNGRWQYVNYATGSGTFYIYAVNGQDKPRLYDGTTWTAIDGVSTPAITGVTTTTLIHINVFKTRLFFVQSGTMKAWYLPVNSIGGAATALDFSSIFRMGGSLQAMATWTIDGGYGMDDHAVFITSEGEIAVYRGTDPSSPSTWALVGVYSIGSPVGRRCFVKYAGDLLMITKDGVSPLSKALISSRVTSRTNITEKIQDAVSSAVSSYGNNFGWQMEVFPNENMLFVNVPIAIGAQQQYVMNTITGAWCNFTGWNANVITLHRDDLYFGGNGVVAKIWQGNSDNGANIVANAIPAYNYFGSRSTLKNWRMVRPVFAADGPFGVLIGLNTDFDTTDPVGTPTFSPSNAALWDSAIWDTSVWGGLANIAKDWQTCYGLGYCATLHVLAATNTSNVSWAATDFVFERGGIL
jgi:hypothetical protein